ncbi:FHA domain containing protein [Fibrisoma limi BUZ 3]|uniref:FHA domain containing protein n=1 Tax=Fibrisoma limi BUZ 3 TaxID=1185876 RepID=I2GJT2_9BACT|nr:FHA domain-containing protein [Fibrisoma limi]CCH54157.1 FHA domain containing protein [Fibrisoma limi BUZ 3]
MSVSVLSTSDDQFEKWIDQLSKLPTYTIGRGANNSIVIANGKISGQHARLIYCTNTTYVLEDLNSKNGTYVNGMRITRKVIGAEDKLRLADSDYTVNQLMDLLSSNLPQPVIAEAAKPLPKESDHKGNDTKLSFTQEFAELRQVFEQYPKLRKDCRNREKMIRTGSVILSSVVGVSAALATGGTMFPLLQIMSGAGLSMLVPTLCSTLLSTEEKLEIIDKEYRDKYRCPNPNCRDPFVNREWDLLAQQKACRRCQAIWVN